MEDVKCKAVVQKVILQGKHGSFVVATSEELKGSVTFSLEPTVWMEEEYPEEGVCVLLGKLRQKRAGWRAKTARFFKPSDEQKERSNAVNKKVINLGAMVDEFAGQVVGSAVPTSVALYLAIERVRVALRNMGDDKRIEFLDGVLELWCNGKPLEDLHKIFGDKIDVLFGERLMYTLTADGQQFRCWYSGPGRISPNHVDSCGKGCLLDISGSPEVVRKYINALLSECYQEKAIKLPNGVKIFGFWWDQN